MSNNQAFLVYGPALTPVDNEFQVRTGAVRLFGANLGVAYNIQVYVGNQSSGAWVNAYVNGQQLQLTDTNNVMVLLVAGQYRIVTSDDSTPTINTLVWYVESEETDHDSRVMYVLQVSAPGGGGGGGGTPSDTVTEVGVNFGRDGDPGISPTYSRGDHTHFFDVLPDQVVTDGVAAVASSTTDALQFSIDSTRTIFSKSTRELVVVQTEFDITATSTSVTPPIRVPSSYTSGSVSMGLIDLAGYAICSNGVNPIPVPCATDISMPAVTAEDVRNYLGGSPPNWNTGGSITVTATYALAARGV